MKSKRNDLRNIAIIAHVDHGKTTLVDNMLKQAKIFRENQHVAERVMDSNDLERERGITILAKNTAITVPDGEGNMVKINIVDTPGHADFGGEVERIMNMVDGVLLLVDAAEGPKPQTRFVLRQAIRKNLPAIVVINKMDRRDADHNRALNLTFDLFIELGASEALAEFPVLYANGIEGRCGETPELSPNLQPLFATIFNYIPCPEVDEDAPFQMLVTSLGYDEYKGATAVGRINRGRLAEGALLARCMKDGSVVKDTAKYLFEIHGLEKKPVQQVRAGDIITIAGLENIAIGETLADPEHPDALPVIEVEIPTVRMTFGVNTSPLTGREGKWSTSRRLRDRLFQELRTNIALRVNETDSADRFLVSGRGELHLGILIETMRREGYEFEVSRPEAIIIEGVDGIKQEPYEEVHIDVIADEVGTVVEMLGGRQGKMVNMHNNTDGTVHLIYIIPTRALLGFRYQFLTATRGQGVINTLFYGYDDLAQGYQPAQSRSIVSREAGETTTFGLKNAEERGILFYGPGVEVYEGMVVGENAKPEDISVNVCKKKALTNMRQSNKDIEVRLKTPRTMSLDECIEYLSSDELLEVTPQNLRVRKRVLDTEERGKHEKRLRELWA
ncbi:MAG: translational GTPase TypA [Anaerolineae bacterium]|nr:translational GTPase TypA [Anaerolineae bacterium]